MAKRPTPGRDPGQRWPATAARAALTAAGESGLSLGAFAQREGIDPQRLYWWRQRLGADAAATRSRRAAEAEAPMCVEGGITASRDAPAVEVLLRNGRVMEGAALVRRAYACSSRPSRSTGAKAPTA